MDTFGALWTRTSQENPSAARFLEAAKSEDGRQQLAQLLILDHAHIDTRNEGGLTALHLAILQGHVEAVDALLDQGADAEAEYEDEKRPLYMAVEAENADIVAILLGHGAQPSAAWQGQTPLHEAVSRANIDITRMLLESGAEVNEAGRDGREPLFLAVLSRNTDIIELLLDHGADPDAFFYEDPPTALHLASQNGDLKAMGALIRHGARVDPRDHDGATPLFNAVGAGHVPAVRLLLKRGAETNVWRSDGVSLLGLAEGNIDMLELIRGVPVHQGPRIKQPNEALPEDEQPPSVLTPSRPPGRNERDKLVACQGFQAMMFDFFTGGEHEQMIPKTAPVRELLYSHGPGALRSQLGTDDPSFTWYHLPSNNMIWVETLVRRLMAEKGNVSAEDYDELRSELELLEASKSSKKSSRLPNRLSALRPHCRRVSTQDSEDRSAANHIVSVIPYLHFEMYDDYKKMADALESVRDGRRSQFSSMPHAIAHPQQSSRTSGQGPARPSRRSTFRPPLPADSSASSDATHRGVSHKVSRWRRGLDFMAGKLGRPQVAFTSSSDHTTTDDPDLEGQAEPEKSWQAWGKQTTGPEAASQATRQRSLPDKSIQESRPASAIEPKGSTTGPETVPLPASCSSDADFSMQTEGPRDSTLSVAPGRSRDKLEPDSRESIGPKAASTSKTQPEQSNARLSKKTTAIPAPRKTKRVRIAPPSGNLHEHLIYGYYNPERTEYQPRRTLDQYGYAGIESTSHRDDDQVIYRYTKSDPLAVRKIFMVDQLWMWVLGNDTIITCAPLRWNAWTQKDDGRRHGPVRGFHRPEYLRWLANMVSAGDAHARQQRLDPRVSQAMAFVGGQGFKRRMRSEPRPIPHFSDPLEGDKWPKLDPYDPLNITQRVTQHLFKSNRGAIRSVHDLGAVIASCCVDVFDSRQAPEDYQFFDFFDRSINKANDRVSSYLRNFKEALAELSGGLTEHEVMDITQETELMIEVEDILDELHSLKTVLKDQRVVIADLNGALQEAGETWSATPVDIKTLETHLQHIERMEEAAQKADTSLHRLMDLKQKQASLIEALYARESARDTARQGKTIIVFTVVTIIFLPVSFIAAVFSVDTNGFPRDGEEKIPFDYVMRSILTIGLGISVPLIVIAFNVDRIAFLLYKMRAFESRLLSHLLSRKLFLLGALAIPPSILAPIWTSELSTGAKIAATTVLAMLGLGFLLSIGVRYITNVAMRSLGASTLTTTTGNN